MHACMLQYVCWSRIATPEKGWAFTSRCTQYTSSGPAGARIVAASTARRPLLGSFACGPLSGVALQSIGCNLRN